ETYSTHVSSGSPPRSSASRTRSSITARNAARVLPDPVGAEISVGTRRLIASHARSCTAVGASKARANHPATAGWSRSIPIGQGYATRRREAKNVSDTIFGPKIVSDTFFGWTGSKGSDTQPTV